MDTVNGCDFSLIDISSAENLDHLASETRTDEQTRLRRYLIDVRIEKIVLQLRLLDEHTRVKETRLIEVDVYGIVLIESFLLDKLLNRRHLAVYK